MALAMSASAMMVLVGGVLGAQLAPKSQLATLPVAMMIVGTASSIYLITAYMRKVGRRRVFRMASLAAVGIAALAGWAAIQESFFLFVFASFLLGGCVATFQQIRFAAMESVPIEKAPQAASTVLLGGLVAAILGPELATRGRDLFEADYVGSFLLLAAVAMMCFFLFSFIQDTVANQVEHSEPQRPIAAIVKQPLFIIAVSCAVVGYALMSFIMTATPIHMHVIEQFSLEHTKWVIQSHIIAMFAPSLFSGLLIARFGVNRIIVLGLGAYALTIALAISGSEWLNYWSALVLLGLGWNLLFLSGTVLLPQSHRPEERFRVQGMNELAVFGSQAVAALSAGVALYYLGWRGLMMVSMVILIGQVLLLISQGYRARQNVT